MDHFYQQKAYFAKGIYHIFNHFPTIDSMSLEINNASSPLIFWVFPVILIGDKKQSWLKHTYEYYKYKNYDEQLAKILDVNQELYTFEFFLNYLKSNVSYFNDSHFISQLHCYLMNKNQSPWYAFQREKLEANILEFCEDKSFAFYERLNLQLIKCSKEEDKKIIKI